MRECFSLQFSTVHAYNICPASALHGPRSGIHQLTRLAREQKIEASREELAEHIARMAQRLSMPMDKLVKQLVKREALGSVEGEVVRDKALDFLASKVKVKTAESAA